MKLLLLFISMVNIVKRATVFVNLVDLQMKPWPHSVSFANTNKAVVFLCKKSKEDTLAA